MWSVFLFARKPCWLCLEKGRCSCAKLLYAVWSIIGVLVAFVNVAPCFAAEGHASFASLLAGGLSPIGLGGYSSSPARYADPSYGVSYYWMDDIDELSWNLSLEFGNDSYRVGAFIAYQSMDSLYRNVYSEVAYAHRLWRFVPGASYAIDMEWVPGKEQWARHRIKLAIDYKWHEIHLAGMLCGFLDNGLSPIVGVHWLSDDAIKAFAESDFDYLYVGASFHWKFMELNTSYRFPDFAVAIQLSFGVGRYGISYARGFKHNSIGWNGVHVTRWVGDGRRKNN